MILIAVVLGAIALFCHLIGGHAASYWADFFLGAFLALCIAVGWERARHWPFP
jgi:hypothetical protein